MLRVLAISAALSMAASAGAQSIDFGRDVRPILADHCFACHGPDEAHREAGLRLDVREDATRLRDGEYAAIVAGDTDSSELVWRIRDALDPMPPAEVHERPTDEQIDILIRWIEEGAPYDAHWAYEMPQPPAADAQPSIDTFVRTRLDEAGIDAAPEADPRTLVRRLSFDLTGLPPTPEQVEMFAANPTPAARDALVEELLASPHHAERMTTFWFDLVRYADTTGIHADNRWNMSPYRDWVIEAFSQNMPFDRFTREQIAGDLLEGATLSQQVAASYNRLNLITREGGSQPKEFLARYTADRVRNVSEVWLATTLGCAECHDHKFDAITTREFYEFGAFFADIEQVGVYLNGNNTYLPELQVPSMMQQDEVSRLTSELAAVEAVINADTPELANDQLRWERELGSDRWVVPDRLAISADGDTQLAEQPDRSILATGGEAERDVFRVSFDAPTSPVHALRLELLPDESLPREGPGRAGNGNLVVTEFEVFVSGQPVAIASSEASYEQPNYPIAHAHNGEAGDRAGWAVMRENNGAPAEAVFTLDPPIAAAGERIEIAIHQNHGGRHTLGRWRVSWTDATETRAVDPEIRVALAGDPDERTDEQRQTIRSLHRAQTPLLADERAQRDRTAADLQAVRAAIPLVLQTRSVEPMVTRVLPRGNWMDESGEIVSPGVPAILGGPELTAEQPNRLDLADWLVDPDNPLVARVLVNRIWRMFMGRGVVQTLDDFGVQGTEPTHPQLLDYLATELVNSGWDVRHVVRLIVTSSAYARASNVETPGDPGNTWFGRQARHRLDAEFVRDNALAVSGLLVREIGGPSVRPYQPAGYWAHLNFPRRTYAQSEGNDLYRRALYGHWQRQYLHPSLLAFDAPSRERCTAERPRSNTPQAALALLNDPIFVEAARALAEITLQRAEGDDRARVDWMWQRVLQRDPRAFEMDLISDLLDGQRVHYRERPDEAARLLAVGESARDETIPAEEHAAWTAAARVILNLHETIVRN